MTLSRRLRSAAVALCLLALAACKHAQHAAPVFGSGDDETASPQVQAHAHYMAGVVADLNESPAEALEQFNVAARLDPENNDLLLEVSERLSENGRTQDACDILAKAATRANASGEIHARLGLVQAQLGQTNQAIASCRAALRKSPNAVEAYRTLFAIYARDKQFTQAHEILDQASRQPDLPLEFAVAIPEMYTALSRLAPDRREELQADAVRALNAAEKRNPSDPDLRLKIADGFNALGQRDQAAPIYLDILNRYPDSPIVRTQVRAKLIDIYLRGQDRTNAATQLEAMVRDHPSDPQLHFLLGSIASEQKRPERAAECFRRALLFNPDFEPAYYDLAMAQIAMNDSTNALATLANARTKFGGKFITEFLSGIAYGAQTNHTAAIQCLTSAEVIAQATDRQRLNEYLYFQIGVAYERLGNIDQAVVYLEKCLEVAPKFTEALNYLGYLWADRGENLPRARQLLEQAVQLEPENGAFLDSLGWAMFKLGQNDKALDYIKKAISFTKEPDPTLFEHLGDIYEALNDPAQARDAWQKSLKLDPKNQKLERKLHPQPAPTSEPVPASHP